MNTTRIPFASFKSFKKTETLQLITNPNPESDNHACICVMYEPRKVYKTKVRFYPLKGQGGRPPNKLLFKGDGAEMDSSKYNVDSTIDFVIYHFDCWNDLNLAKTQVLATKRNFQY